MKSKMKNLQESSSSQQHQSYRGVRMRTEGKWVCEIREPRKTSRIWLGTYPSPEMAARAHDAAALSLKGKSAILNFPELADSLPRPVSLAPRDVQTAAAKAAKMDNLESPPPSSSAAMDLKTGSEELTDLVHQMPSLCSSYDLEMTEFRNDFLHFDLEDSWNWYTPPWSQDLEDDCGTATWSLWKD